MASKETRRTIQDVFKVAFSGEDGKTMLYWILNECGYFAVNPSLIKPDLIALANRLLNAGGITAPQSAGKYIDNLMLTAREAEHINDNEEDDEYEI